RHWSLAIANTVSNKHIPFPPPSVIDRIGCVPCGPPLILVNGRIHVAIETEATSISRPWDGRNNVRTVGIQPYFTRLKSFARKPLEYVVRHGTFTAGRAVNVREIERDLHKFIGIDFF